MSPSEVRKAFANIAHGVWFMLANFTDSQKQIILSLMNEHSWLPDGYKISTTEDDCDAEGCMRGFTKGMDVGNTDIVIPNLGQCHFICKTCNGTGKKPVDSSDEAAREVLGY